MPEYRQDLRAIVQILENQTYLAEGLFFPEVSCYRATGRRVLDDIQKQVRARLMQAPPISLAARQLGADPEVGEIVVEMEAPRGSGAWRGALPLHFSVLRWTSPDGGLQIGFVPALGIEVVATTAAERETQLPVEIRHLLLRTKSLESLKNLIWLQRTRKLRLFTIPLDVMLPTPKQAAQEALAQSNKKKAILPDVATNLIHEGEAPAYHLDDVVAHLAEVLTAAKPRSVLLVGPSGVGKTAAVRELVRQRRHWGMSQIPFWATSGARLVAGMSGFGMWEERCQAVCREAAKTKAVLHLGNLVELMEVGKSESSGLGIAGFLRPYLARGDLLGIVECTPEQLPVIERMAPQLLDLFHQLPVPEPSLAIGRQILEQFAHNWRAPGSREILASLGGSFLAPAALETLDRLHRRYATYSAYPGRPLRFLQNLLHDQIAPRGTAEFHYDETSSNLSPITAAEVTAAFARETGLPRFLLDDRERLDLLSTRDWFADRVIGQPEPVDLVVDLLATVKAGLSRPRKPIASLMFIGPTGVGKTEMSKALAQFLFGDPHRMLRFDMSEFGDALAVNRLIGGIFGAEGLLTAKVREQPFSVILFDEVEKASPLFFDLLLQILGEGRLTDASGRLADFCNAVIIMTSNLGAESFQQGGVGFAQGARGPNNPTAHFMEAVRQFVRPELYNRIDRIVPFTPLSESTVLRIAEAQLQQLQKRDGILYRGLTLRIDQPATRLLAAHGYDPRYGARPLKRTIERELLAPLAERLNQYAAETALEADVTAEGDRLRIAVRARQDAAGRVVQSASSSPLFQASQWIVHYRRLAQRLEFCPARRDLQNDIDRLSELERRLQRAQSKKRAGQIAQQRASELQELHKLEELRRTSSQIDATIRSIFDAEVEVLEGFYGGAGKSSLKEGNPNWMLDLDARWQEALYLLYERQFPRPHQLTFALFGENQEALCRMAEAYLALWSEEGTRVEAFRFVTQRADDRDLPQKRPGDEKISLWRRPMKTGELPPQPSTGTIGFLFGLQGRRVFPRFGQEQGLHSFLAANRTDICLVETSPETTSAYLPPEAIERQGTIGLQDKRRNYVAERQTSHDFLLREEFGWFNRGLPRMLQEIIERCLQRNALALIAPPAETPP